MSCQALFAATDGAAEDVTISVSMLEIYNESVRDLLGGASAPNLEVSGLGPGELQPGVRSSNLIATISCDKRRQPALPILPAWGFYAASALLVGTDRVAARTWRVVRNHAEVLLVLEVCCLMMSRHPTACRTLSVLPA